VFEGLGCWESVRADDDAPCRCVAADDKAGGAVRWGIDGLLHGGRLCGIAFSQRIILSVTALHKQSPP